LRRIAVEVGHEQRTRSNQTHVAAQNVPELREFVEAQPPDVPRQWRESFGIGQGMTALIGRILPRPELVDTERFAIQPGPCLPKESCGPVIDPQRRPRDKDDRGRKDERDTRNHYVEDTLEDQASSASCQGGIEDSERAPNPDRRAQLALIENTTP